MEDSNIVEDGKPEISVALSIASPKHGNGRDNIANVFVCNVYACLLEDKASELCYLYQKMPDVHWEKWLSYEDFAYHLEGEGWAPRNWKKKVEVLGSWDNYETPIMCEKDGFPGSYYYEFTKVLPEGTYEFYYRYVDIPTVTLLTDQYLQAKPDHSVEHGNRNIIEVTSGVTNMST